MHEIRSTDKVRLDKWLWAARFFKTRPLATEAVTGGKVHVNGSRVKPGKLVSIGDQITIRRGPYRFEVTVRDLSARRGPASQATSLYEETDESRQDRARIAEQRKQQQEFRAQQRGRPSKRDRRVITRFLRRHR
jgi:ribosome-associated heat shock protein Hsp15